ncbi:MAG: VanZ family protein [Candidatus Woesebacteria bacterium]
MTKQILKYSLLLVWMLVIFAFSNEVSSDSSARSAIFVDVLSGYVGGSTDFLTFLTRKAAHIFIYFVLGVLAFNVAVDYKINTRRMIWFSIIFVACYASFDEFHQLFIPGRSGEPRDVIIDTIAGGIGVLAYYFAQKAIHVRKKRQISVK